MNQLQINIFLITIGVVITFPFLFLSYKFHQYNQYKNENSWIKMISWLFVIIFYWLMYSTI